MSQYESTTIKYTKIVNSIKIKAFAQLRAPKHAPSHIRRAEMTAEGGEVCARARAPFSAIPEANTSEYESNKAFSRRGGRLCTRAPSTGVMRQGQAGDDGWWLRQRPCAHRTFLSMRGSFSPLLSARARVCAERLGASEPLH